MTGAACCVVTASKAEVHKNNRAEHPYGDKQAYKGYVHFFMVHGSILSIHPSPWYVGV